MKTLLIENGDFVIGPGGYAMVSGAKKVEQDLGIAVREPYGSDRFHPRWGSLLHEYVGRYSVADGGGTDVLIQAEIQRVVQNYSFAQGDQLERDATMGRRSRFGTGELVDSISSIEIRQETDRYHLRVKIKTLSGEQVSVIRSVR